MWRHARLELELADQPSSVRTARRAVTAFCATLEVEPSNAALIVSELVANAVEHGHGPVTTTACWQSSRVRVEVTDEGHGQPTVEHPELLRERGRGLMIVAALADKWGVAETTSGTLVWAELAY